MSAGFSSIVRATAIFALVSSQFAAQPAQAQDLSGMMVGPAISMLRGQLDNIIKSASQDFDLVVFNAATEARGALDAWERVNSNLLDKAFDRLDTTQRQMFQNIEKTIDQLNEAGSDRLKQAQSLTDTAAQIVATIPTNRKAYINRYGPRVVFPGGTTPVALRLHGTHLNKAKLAARIGDGKPLEQIESTATSASFLIPDSAFVGPDGASRPLSITVSYLASPYAWFGKDPSTAQVAPWVMPMTMASYRVSATVGVEQIERKMETFHTGRLSGRNRNVFKGIRPPDGWRFDLERFDSVARVRGDGGEAGRCQKVADEDRAENGVKIQGRVDEIRQGSWRGVRYDDGWIRCIAELPIYRVVKSSKLVDVGGGQLGWYKTVRLDAPQDVTSWQIQMKTFDGRELVFNGPANDRYVSISADSTGVMLTPKRPSIPD